MSATILANAVAIGRGILADPKIGVRADTYDLIRLVETDDGEGGATTTEEIIERGGGTLVAGGLQPEERAIADRRGATVAYAVRNMRHDSQVDAQHVIAIAGRRFEVLGRRKVEALNVSVTAVCQERS